MGAKSHSLEHASVSDLLTFLSVVRHGALVNFLRSMQRAPGLQAQEVVAALTTISFDIATLEIYLPWLVGARVELLSRDVASDGIALAQALDDAGIGVVQATPATWRLLLEAGWKGRAGLRAFCGGEALPRDLADVLLLVFVFLAVYLRKLLIVKRNVRSGRRVRKRPGAAGV